jgi:hypothetical protein
MRVCVIGTAGSFGGLTGEGSSLRSGKDSFKDNSGKRKKSKHRQQKTG